MIGAVASRLELLPRNDDPSLGHAVLVELEVVNQKSAVRTCEKNIAIAVAPALTDRAGRAVTSGLKTAASPR